MNPRGNFPQTGGPTVTKSSRSEAVKVVVRCRPMSKKEENQGHTQIIDMWPERGIVYITNPRRPLVCSGKKFIFDSVYDSNANQDDLYKSTVKPLVFSVLDGYNGTIFAYGQTGTGKTYTMLGSRCSTKEKGITSKCFEDIFRHIHHASEHTSFVVRASYLEIYQEETRDLLTPDVCKKPLREDVLRGVYVQGLQSVDCRNIKAIERVMRMGNMNRATAATNMNEHSSRSHAIFQITIEMQDCKRGGPGFSHPGRGGLRVGKLNLVDLAGSERQCKTGAVGERLKESGKINLSLSVLGNVISALVDGRSSHIPYRDSKLTQLLQDSLGGNSKCIMIANIGPASYNYDESLMTLRYASRAKHIKNMPTRNQSSGQDGADVRSLQSLLMVPGPESTSDSGSGADGEQQRVRLTSRDRCGRRRIPHAYRRVWRLHGKYHQETTVQMVRWIQEQINNTDGSPGVQSGENSPEKLQGSTKAELQVQDLVDDLSDAVRREEILQSLPILRDEVEQRDHETRAFLKMAAEVKELRRRVERQHHRQRAALRSEQARLRKEVALRHAVLRAYMAQRKELPALLAPQPALLAT